jgi:MFS family permease
MSQSNDDIAAGHASSVQSAAWMERIGIPAPMFWGFVGVLLFMVGDGVEISYLTKYLTLPTGGGLSGSQASFATVTVYGIAVLIASWFSGTLSSIWGPRRVMWLGAVWWVGFELLFLFVAIPTQSFETIVIIYGLRGFAYPLFSFGFLVWVQTLSKEKMRSSAAGWFWFVFTGGLPTLGAAVASVSFGVFGVSLFGTLVLSMVLVAVGGLIGSLVPRHPTGLQPLADETVTNPRSPKRLLEGFDILWRDKRMIAGLFTRLVNTSPEYGFFAMIPFTFGASAAHGGFLSLAQIATMTSIVYAVNIAGNLLFGLVGDYLGWRRTITWFGCVGCALATPLWYFGSMASGSFALAILFGSIFGILLAGFVPLTAIMPAMAQHKDKGAALAILNTGAGGAAFVGPVIVTAVYPFLGGGGVAIVYAVLYIIVAILSYALRDSSDPLVRRKEAAAASETST